jgi:hypothetical protein
MVWKMVQHCSYGMEGSRALIQFSDHGMEGGIGHYFYGKEDGRVKSLVIAMKMESTLFMLQMVEYSNNCMKCGRAV